MLEGDNIDNYYSPDENINGYSIIKILGEGRYGIVYLAEDGNFKKYVIKQLKKGMLDKTRSKLYYESEILSKLNNNRFPKFITSYNYNETEGYILEYIYGKDFYEILAKDEYEFSKNEIYNIAEELLNIIYILQENSIVHRDIRTSNVILNEDNQLVLIDFGLARYIDNNRYLKEVDYWYLADFLLHLYYSSYYPDGESVEKPWYEELNLNSYEIRFLKKLMSIEEPYKNIEEIRADLDKIKNLNI